MRATAQTKLFGQMSVCLRHTCTDTVRRELFATRLSHEKKKKVEFQIWDLLCMVPPGSTTMAYPGRYHLARYRTHWTDGCKCLMPIGLLLYLYLSVLGRSIHHGWTLTSRTCLYHLSTQWPARRVTTVSIYRILCYTHICHGTHTHE